MNLLVGVTGSVAAKLTPKLVSTIGTDLELGAVVKIIATEKSLYFWKPIEVMEETFQDHNEWKDYLPGSPVLHIELRNWADVLLIAPLSANTLAKIANGYADNLLTSVVRAWDRTKPVIFAPAMNTQMWEHPVTEDHITKVAEWYRSTWVQPIKKKLACGDDGLGAMADISDIISAIRHAPKRAPFAPKSWS